MQSQFLLVSVAPATKLNGASTVPERWPQVREATRLLVAPAAIPVSSRSLTRPGSIDDSVAERRVFQVQTTSIHKPPAVSGKHVRPAPSDPATKPEVTGVLAVASDWVQYMPVTVQLLGEIVHSKVKPLWQSLLTMLKRYAG